MTTPQLLHGPYTPPPVRKGGRARCLYRHRRIVITGWTEAPIPWPRGTAVGSRGGYAGPLVCRELVRAIRNESALAVMHWWGVSPGTVARWRKAFRVDKVNNPGTNRLVRKAAAKGLKAALRRVVTAEERSRRRRTAKRLNLIRYARAARSDTWTAAELRLLGKMPDVEVARRTGRTVNGVRIKRHKLGIANPFEGRRRPRR